MSSVPNAAVCDTPALTTVPSTRSAALIRLSDYVALTKPRISMLVLLTVTAGYALGSGDAWQGLSLVHALFGIALVAAGSSALNQFFERDTDALMRRTATRPLPAGRLSPAEVLWFGLIAGAGGTAYLAAFVNAPTAILSATTFLLYAGVYTPLKRKTTLNTAIGAVPGALPPVLGWVAAGAPLDAGAFSLFAILFLWQFPHFLAIAWIYRDEYSRAGLKMIPGSPPAPRVTGLMAVGYALALLPLGLYPAFCGLAGSAYIVVALILGIAYLFASVRFAADESHRTARGLLWTSLVYLPMLFTVLAWDHFRLLS